VQYDEGLSAASLRKKAIKNRLRNRVWVKMDPETGVVDTQREMVNINNLPVYKLDIYLMERIVGVSLVLKNWLLQQRN